MKTRMTSPRSALPTARRQHGVALPISLIVMAILTAVVLMQLRRSTTDERLASHSRETTVLASAAETVLRSCEIRLEAEFVHTQATLSHGISRIDAPTGASAWRDPANWVVGRMHQISNDALPPSIAWAACLVENATEEIPPRSAPLNDEPSVTRDPNLVKFRITAQVRMAEPGVPANGVVPAGFRGYFSQSELQIYR